jgi:hypothetical protein
MWSAFVKGGGFDRVANRAPNLLVVRAEYSCPESPLWNVSRKPTARYGLPLLTTGRQRARKSYVSRQNPSSRRLTLQVRLKVDRVQSQEKFADFLKHCRAALKAHGFPMIPVQG